MGLDQLIKTEHRFRVFTNRDEWADAATSWIADNLSNTIASRGEAVIALSGGSTPVPVYGALSNVKLAWEKIRVEIVDDRETADPDGRNARMIEKTLRKNNAAAYVRARFDEATATANAHLDLCVMGMGTDGHTASWFPGAKGLSQAMDLNAPFAIKTIDATGCPGAGKYPRRNTMTLPAVLNSRQILLLLTGEEKRRVFETAAQKSVYDAPVKALLAAGPRLTVMWAP